MPDMSLPPVGELVQITTNGGQKLLGVYQHDGGFLLVGPRPAGTGGWWPGWETAEWCRVLVLPDTDELTDRIAAAHRDMRWDEWQAFAARDPVQADNYRQLVRGYVAAVRGAAIR